MTTLLLTPTLQYGGAASQTKALALDLQREQGEVHVAVIGASGPWEADLGAAGVRVHHLNWMRQLDPAPLWNLRELLHELKPAAIHAFESASLRCLAAVDRHALERTWAYRLIHDLTNATPVDRLLLKSVRGAVARTQWEAAILDRQGFRADRLTHMPLSVSEEFLENASTEIEASGIVNVSRLEHRHGPRDALWTMDMLAYAFPDLSLTIIGAGSLAADLRELQQCVHFAGQTRFLPSVADMGAMLRQAKVCWITARPGHGLQTALEAQACGCPLVAYDQPALRELVIPGETALLVPADDMVALARTTFTLLKDEARRREMGVAGKRWIRSRQNAEAEHVVEAA